MYFTELDECPEDPITLNEAFEAKYDTDEYEARVSKLMHHAYRRIKKDNPEGFRRSKEAMKELSKGAHYMLVLCEDGAPARPVTVFVKFCQLLRSRYWLCSSQCLSEFTTTALPEVVGANMWLPPRPTLRCRCRSSTFRGS